MKKLGLLCTAMSAAMFAFSHNATATTLTIGDAHTLGYDYYGIPSGDQDRTNYVNDLVYMYNTSLTTWSNNGQNYQIINGAPTFGALLPTAVFGVNFDENHTSINLGTGSYSYLFAKYDGPNQGSVIWYVGNLSGTVTIPSDWNGYGLSGSTLFTPGGQVPEGGATVLLFGAALGTLGMVRRLLTSSVAL